MVEQREDARFCPNCGQEVGAEDRFCNNCGHNLSVPPLGEGRIETESVNVPPPPASQTSPGQQGLGGFLRSFGFGAGACLGMAVALMLLLMVALVGCAVLVGVGRGVDENRGAGEALQTVPDLENAASIDEAERIADEAGDFEVVEGTRQATKEPEGAIVGQTPDPGEKAEEGSRIYVIVSDRQVGEIPAVGGQTSEVALS